MNEKQLSKAMAIIGSRGGKKQKELHKDKLAEWGREGARIREEKRKKRAVDNS